MSPVPLAVAVPSSDGCCSRTTYTVNRAGYVLWGPAAFTPFTARSLRLAHVVSSGFGCWVGTSPPCRQATSLLPGTWSPGTAEGRPPGAEASPPLPPDSALPYIPELPHTFPEIVSES